MSLRAWWICLLAMAIPAFPSSASSAEHQQSPVQRAFCDLAAKYRIVSIFGGLQGGKSLAGADAVFELLYGRAPVVLPGQTRGKLNMDVWFVSKNYALGQQMWSYFLWRCAGRNYTLDECRTERLVRNDSRTYWLRPRGPDIDRLPIRVTLKTATDPENLRAVGTLGACWADEVAYWPELSWLNLQGRGIVTPTRYVVTTTARGKNWSYRQLFLPCAREQALVVGGHAVSYRETPAGDMATMTARSADNPWADPVYLEALRKRFGEQYAAQELDAQFVDNVGYVYDFDRALHVAEPPSKDAADYEIVVAGVDPGYGDPYAVGWWGKDDAGTWWLLDEFYQTKRDTEQLIGIFRSKQSRWKARTWWVDKRRPSDIEILRRAGIPAKPNLEVFGENDRRTIMPMVRIVQGLLRAGRLKVSPSCDWHIHEFETYAFAEREEKNAGENPIDFSNHACFPKGTLIATPSGDKPIESINLGDEVITHLGVGRAETSAAITGRERIYRLTLEDGRSIISTASHPIYVEPGEWVDADQCLRRRVMVLQSSVVAGHGGLRQTATIAIRSEKPSIDSFGSVRLDPFQAACTSITRTETLRTIESKISPCCPARLISKSMLWRLPHGINRLRAARGIVVTLGLSPKRSSEKKLVASVATHSTGARSREDSVPTPVNRPQEEQVGSMTSSLCARSAAIPTSRINTLRALSVVVPVRAVCVEAIAAITKTDVWNFATSHGTYFANGILVSNCDAMRYALVSEEAPRMTGQRIRQGRDQIPRRRPQEMADKETHLVGPREQLAGQEQKWFKEALNPRKSRRG